MKLAFTIDFEDWYQGIGLDFNQWDQYEKRIQIGHYKLLNILSKNKTKATYFLLGKTIEDHPNLVKEIIAEGHEIACHTYSHPFLYELNEQQFEEEIDKCKKLIEPFNVKYTGFRAPYFSIDTRNLWVLDSLTKNGFQYDSSIFPGDTKRTGIPNFRVDYHKIKDNLYEFPVSKFKLGKFDVGIGGAYFRILPYAYFKQKLKNVINTRDAFFYIHPWELDPNHPKITNLPKRIQYTHYFNLKSTEKRIQKLFNDFEFTSLSNILKINNNN